jgi:hypothetical protein
MNYLPPPERPGEVAEILGLYGPVSIPELLIQKIWLRGDFRREGLRTTDGRPLAVIHPGRWNRLGGPDFLGAEIELEGRRLLGDVEIHFYARDWRAHRHDLNPAFDGTVLHVVVFAPEEEEARATTAAGRALPTLALAPLLREGLEEYAMRDALRALEQIDPLELAAPLLAMPLEARRERLRAAAALRWHQKTHWAEKRLRDAGSWEEACHRAILEILGYRRNRGPMAEAALRFPLALWRAEAAGAGWPEAVVATFSGQWRLDGCRPANLPRRRLQQYGALLASVPDWPERVARVLRALEGTGEVAEATRAFRQRHRLGAVRREIFGEAWGGHLASPRADTVLIDGLLPLAAVAWQREELYLHWVHWWPGDLPDALRILLRTAHVVSPAWPLSNGLQQAALQLLFER